MVDTKQPITKQPAKQIDARDWNSIHLMGFGEAQIIGKNNGKVANENLKSIAPFISHLMALQQEGTRIDSEELHAIHIFNSSFIDFLPKPKKENKRQRFQWAQIDDKIVGELAFEIMNNIRNQ